MTRLHALFIVITAVFCIGVAVGSMLQSPAKAPRVHASSPHQTAGVSVQIAAETPRIVLEAESGKIVAPIQVYENKDASGGKYVMTPEPPGENLATGGQVEFTLNIKDAGKYNLWLRVEFDDSCDNSLFAKVGDGDAVEVTDNTFEKWQWIKVGRLPFDLKSGAAPLVVGSRENGSRLDEILLTQDLAYVPVGMEAVR